MMKWAGDWMNNEEFVKNICNLLFADENLPLCDLGIRFGEIIARNSCSDLHAKEYQKGSESKYR